MRRAVGRRGRRGRRRAEAAAAAAAPAADAAQAGGGEGRQGGRNAVPPDRQPLVCARRLDGRLVVFVLQGRGWSRQRVDAETLKKHNLIRN